MVVVRSVLVIVRDFSMSVVSPNSVGEEMLDYAFGEGIVKGGRGSTSHSG